MVEFLTAWNGTPTGKRVELGAVEEARLIAAGIARAYTVGQEKGPGTDLTDAEEAAVRALVSGGGGVISTPFTVNSRDGLGRVTSYTNGSTTYTVTYDAFGVNTISGGGKVRTVARSASGQITGVTDA